MEELEATVRRVQHEVVFIIQNMHKDTEVMLGKRNDSTQIIYSQPPPPGPRPLTTTQLIPALSIVLVLPTVFPGIPGRGGALNYEKQARGEKS